MHDNSGNGILPFNSTGLTISHNEVKHNGMAGIFFFNVDGSLVEKNKIESNNSNGILTQIGSTGNRFLATIPTRTAPTASTWSTPATRWRRTTPTATATSASSPPPETSTAAENKAKHNGNPLQCVGVSCH